MQQFIVYANAALVVPIVVSADNAEHALSKGQAMFDEMTDEERKRSGKLEDILDGVFLVTDLDGNILLEKT